MEGEERGKDEEAKRWASEGRRRAGFGGVGGFGFGDGMGGWSRWRLCCRDDFLVRQQQQLCGERTNEACKARQSCKQYNWQRLASGSTVRCEWMARCSRAQDVQGRG